MQTATEPNNAFSTPGVVDPSSDQQSSNTNLQNPPLASLRVGEIITDDEDLPQVAPLQRESSSEGVSIAMPYTTVISYLASVMKRGDSLRSNFSILY